MKSKKESTKGKRSRRRRTLKIFLGIILLLVIIRLILPYVILKYANNTLANMDGYYGHVRDIDLALHRGAYKIKDIYLNKIDSTSGFETPFFESQIIDLSVEWKALFEGSLVGELLFINPALMFSKEKVEPDELQKDTSDFRKLLKDFMPLRVNRFQVEHGRIHFIDSTSKPIVNIQMDETFILARNLTNAADTSKDGLPADIVANANIYKGTLDFNLRLDPLAEQTKFDMNAEIKDTHLPELNDFFKAYAKVDVNKGTFGMYTELAAADGKFIGYVKPLIKDLDVLGADDQQDSFFRKMWEGFVGSAAKLLSNWDKDQIATKIPLEGKLSDPNPNIWVTIFQMLRNAFINALQPSIDYEINIATVNNAELKEKNFIQKIFGKNDEDPNVKVDKNNKKEQKDNKEENSGKNADEKK